MVSGQTKCISMVLTSAVSVCSPLLMRLLLQAIQAAIQEWPQADVGKSALAHRTLAIANVRSHRLVCDDTDVQSTMQNTLL